MRFLTASSSYEGRGGRRPKRPLSLRIAGFLVPDPLGEGGTLPVRTGQTKGKRKAAACSLRRAWRAKRRRINHPMESWQVCAGGWPGYFASAKNARGVGSLSLAGVRFSDCGPLFGANGETPGDVAEHTGWGDFGASGSWHPNSLRRPRTHGWQKMAPAGRQVTRTLIQEEVNQGCGAIFGGCETGPPGRRKRLLTSLS